MPLEATMLIIDNSEYMRNGDYMPTRFDAQADAVNIVFQTKFDANPESTVGIMTMAGKGPEVLVTHTRDHGPILNGVLAARTKSGGLPSLPTALSVAQLALKHRENKNLRQRIVVFVGSPVDTDEAEMVRLAKKLKKNNVAVDVVAFGDGLEEGAPARVLRAFVDNVNSGDNSHLVTVAPGTHLLSDALIASPILSADRSASLPEELGGTGAPAAGGSSAANDFEFGVDPSLDPELAMALRMSMQEAQAREAASAAAAASESSASSGATASAETPAPATTSVPAEPTDDEEEALLQQALAMSKEENNATEDADGDVEMDDDEEDDDDEEEDEDEDGEDDEEEDEDAAIARAIEMSMQTQEEEKGKTAPKKK